WSRACSPAAKRPTRRLHRPTRRGSVGPPCPEAAPMKPLVPLVLAGLAALALAALGPAAPLPKGNPGVLYDTFDGKLALDWKVVRPDATHVSFKKVPGALVITTQRGSIHGKSQEDKLSEGTLAKNIHLIDIPFKDGDWSATTCVS